VSQFIHEDVSTLNLEDHAVRESLQHGVAVRPFSPLPFRVAFKRFQAIIKFLKEAITESIAGGIVIIAHLSSLQFRFRL